MPGEPFSLNQTSGERTRAGGYVKAPFIVDGELVGLRERAVEVDVAAFERGVAPGPRGALRKATALYQGELLEFPQQRPTAEEIINSDDGVRRLAGYLLRNVANKSRSEMRGGRPVLTFRFDH